LIRAAADDGCKANSQRQDYDWAVREVTRYFEAEPALGTPDGDRFEVLSSLIKEYEALAAQYQLARAYA
jgi:antitoxin component HigA of HigAB toxin-antitoxin module